MTSLSSSLYRIDAELNVDNKKTYPTSASSVKLMPSIENEGGYIKLTTEVNGNFLVGDIVYLCALSGMSGVGYTDTTYVLDNIIETSGCTDWYYHKYNSGYKILKIHKKSNKIIIDRLYESKFDNKSIINHYLTKIYVNNQNITGGNIDGVVYKNVTMNQPTGYTEMDINLIQAIILSGTSIKYTVINDKYDKLYLSLNTNNDYSVSPSTNNNKYGYTIIHNQTISGSTIENGYYYDTTLIDCTINSGSFFNCIISGGTINNGIYSGTTIETNTTWNYGTFSYGNFMPNEWIDGIWNGGDFISKDWHNGIFNIGTFSASTWYDGLFNGGSFVNSMWMKGTFTKSTFYDSEWYDGRFIGNTFQNSIWHNGDFVSGEFVSSTWYDGRFHHGKIINNSLWKNGDMIYGEITDSIWSGGTFHDGTMTDCIWHNGIFNDGFLMSSMWYNGVFNGGTFNGMNSGLTASTSVGASYKSIWYNGTFNGGKLQNAYWKDGIFNSGVVSNSILIKVDWYNGTFNGGIIGPINYNIGSTDMVVNWYNGSFNKGTFGIPSDDLHTTGGDLYMNWYDGDFYYGDFYNITGSTTPGNGFGGWSGGTFWNGSFYGDWYDGTWIQGDFVSPPANWLSDKARPIGISKNIKDEEIFL